MKKKYLIVLLLSFCFLNTFQAQSPCSGAPGSNSIIPSSSFTICSGSSASLGLSNTYSTSGITFSWNSSTTSTVGPWTPVTGADAGNLITPTLTGTMFFMVTITCTNSGQSIQLPVTVSVVPCYTPCPGTPSNTIVPASQTICAGDSAALGFTQSYSLTTGNSWQWHSSSSASGPFNAINGATLSSFNTGSLNSSTYYMATTTCSNGGTTFTATPVAVNVVTCTSCFGTPGSNTITGPSTLCAGSQATLSLAQNYTNTGITYQWQYSSVSQVGPFSPVTGATLSTLVTPTLNANAYYNLVITCTNGGQNISVSHSISVVSCPTACVGFPASASISSSNFTVCSGSTATMILSNNYNNVTGLTFSWTASSSATGPFTVIPGASSPGYTSVPLNTTTYFKAVITCTNVAAGYTTSAFAVQVVNCSGCFGAPGSNSLVPASPTICAGASVTFSTANTYTGSGITYAWQSSTVSLAGPYTTISGATSSTYITPPLNSPVFYNLIITCTNSAQSIQISTPVYVVQCAPGSCAGPPGPNFIQPSNQKVCLGATANMSLASSYTASGYQYQWYAKNSAAGTYSAIPGATSTAFTNASTSGTIYIQMIITCTNTSQFLVLHDTLSAQICVSADPRGSEDALLTLYPNPATQFLSIGISPPVHGQIFIEDIYGRTLITVWIDNPVLQIPVVHLKEGIYLVRIKTSSGEKAAKFIKN